MAVDLIGFIIGRLSQYTGIPSSKIDATQNFEAMGLRSVDAVVLAAELEEILAKEIDVDLFLRCPTLDEVLREIANLTKDEGDLSGRP